MVKDVKKPKENPKAGMHQGVLAFIVNLGEQETPFGKKNKVAFIWELKALMKDGRPFMKSSSYSLTFNEDSNLTKSVQSIIGRKLTNEERKSGFNINSLLGSNANLTIVDGKEEGSQYIDGVGPLMETQEPITTVFNEAPPKWALDVAKAAGVPWEDPRGGEIKDDDIPF